MIKNHPYNTKEELLKAQSEGVKFDFKSNYCDHWDDRGTGNWFFDCELHQYRIKPNSIIPTSLIVKSHVHCELIKQYADGALIQCYDGLEWKDIQNPTWLPSHKYRVKPSSPFGYLKYAELSTTGCKNYSPVKLE